MAPPSEPTLYTWGYGKGTVEQLRELSLRLDATVVDVRSSPSSRKPGFARSALSRELGLRYTWEGQRLGGREPGVTKAGLDLLWHTVVASRRSLIIMCCEYAPGDCHRHHTIALPLAREGMRVRHLVDDGEGSIEVFDPLDLQRALDDADPDAEYDCTYLDD